MILLDAYPLIAHVLDEPAANEVAELLRAGEAEITSVNLAEVLDNLQRRQGFAEERILEVLGPLLDEVVPVRAVEQPQAWRAARLRARHYRRGDSALSLADCLLLASAGEEDAVATSDGALAIAARAEGIRLIALPNSRGERP